MTTGLLFSNVAYGCGTFVTVKVGHLNPRQISNDTHRSGKDGLPMTVHLSGRLTCLKSATVTEDETTSVLVDVCVTSVVRVWEPIAFSMCTCRSAMSSLLSPPTVSFCQEQSSTAAADPVSMSQDSDRASRGFDTHFALTFTVGTDFDVGRFTGLVSELSRLDMPAKRLCWRRSSTSLRWRVWSTSLLLTRSRT